MVSLGLQAGSTMRLLPTWMLRNVPLVLGGMLGQERAGPQGWLEETGIIFCSLPSGTQILLHLGKNIFQEPLVSIFIWIL